MIVGILTAVSIAGWSCVGALCGYIAVIKRANTYKSAPSEITQEQLRKIEKEKKLRQNFLSYTGDEQ